MNTFQFESHPYEENQIPEGCLGSGHGMEGELGIEGQIGPALKYLNVPDLEERPSSETS